MTSRDIYRDRLTQELAESRDALVWLSATPPVWSCGTPVEKWLALRLRESHEERIAQHEKSMAWLAEQTAP